AERGDAQRRAGASLPGHDVPVETRDDRGRLAWNIDEDGRGRAAVHGAVVDAGQHDDRGDRRHRERRGQKESDRRSGAESRQNPDQRADEDPDEAVEEVDRLERNLKAVEDAPEDVDAEKRSAPGGSWLFSQSWKST